MARVSTLVLFVFSVLPFTAAAQGAAQSTPKISVNVDRQPLVQGEPFTLQFTIETEGAGEPEIVIPRFGGLRILKQYESHPSSFHFSFGFGSKATNIQKETANYTFVMVADKPGKYKIDPVMVTINGKRYKGNTYQLEVIKGGGSGGGLSQLPPSSTSPGADVLDDPSTQGLGGNEVTDLEGAKVDPDFFIQTAVSKKEVFVGEMLTMTIYLYMSRQISNYEILREPGTEGFWGENLISSNRRQLPSESVTLGGRMYDRVSLRKMALFPIKPGELTIAPTIVEIEIQRGIFFSKRRAVKRASLPVTVTVKDLPAENQPLEFNPANVGRYVFKAGVDNRSVKVGEPVTLTMTVRGQGNLRNLSLPAIGEIEGLKIYAPETEMEITPREDTVSGTSASRVLMIPKEAGNYLIPKIDWSYFDPAKGEYVTQSSKPIRLAVTASGDKADSSGEVRSTSTSRKAGQDRLNRQLRSILSRADLSGRDSGSTLTRPWFLVLFIGVPLVYIGIAVASRTRRKLEQSRVKNRSKNAENEALRKLRALAKQKTDLAAEPFFAELARCLMGFIEDRLEVKASGDTMTELKERLVSRGFKNEQAEKVVTELETCDFARFAKGAGEKEEQRQAVSRVDGLIKELAGVKVTPKKKEKKS